MFTNLKLDNVPKYQNQFLRKKKKPRIRMMIKRQERLKIRFYRRIRKRLRIKRMSKLKRKKNLL